MNFFPAASAASFIILLCNGVAQAQANAPRAGDAASDFARDRASILAMQGEYDVDFAFDETVLLQPSYERAPAMRSGGSETVIVGQDTPTVVVLQHILVDPKSGHVTKHWRQDWRYEAPTRFEFSADQTWTVHALDAARTKGAWTQCVYEVSDAPRYCGTGAWRHDNGVATWTSDMTARPLPRREYTKRSDYNVVFGVNRHTITPLGWTHEQFNTKTRRSASGALVEIARELGFNEYRKTTDVDFKPAYVYWKATSEFWSGVRARWDGFLSKAPGLRLKTKVDGMAMITPLFEQAATLEAGRTVAKSETDKVFADWVEAAPTASD